jgi:hypothetical protein
VAASRSIIGVGPMVGASSSSRSPSSLAIMACAIDDDATGVKAVGVLGRGMSGRGGPAIVPGAGGGFDFALVVESPESVPSGAPGTLGTGTFLRVT